MVVAGNGGSLDKCRRRWDLADREDLRYKFMNSFDRAMNHLDKAFGFIGAPHTCVDLNMLACSEPRPRDPNPEPILNPDPVHIVGSPKPLGMDADSPQGDSIALDPQATAPSWFPMCAQVCIAQGRGRQADSHGARGPGHGLQLPPV